VPKATTPHSKKHTQPKNWDGNGLREKTGQFGLGFFLLRTKPIGTKKDGGQKENDRRHKSTGREVRPDLTLSFHSLSKFFLLALRAFPLWYCWAHVWEGLVQKPQIKMNCGTKYLFLPGL